MSKCVALRDDGKVCGKNIKKGKYCKLHKMRKTGRLKHGRYAKKSTLGLTEKEDISYKEFLSREKPYDLVSELAQLRTLLVQYRESRSNLLPEKKEEFIGLVKDYIVSYLVETRGMEEERAVKQAAIMAHPMEDVYCEFLEGSTLIDYDYIDTVSSLIDQISKVAEKAKKINEGFTIHAHIDSDYLVDFIQKVVFSVVVDNQNRMAIAENLSLFLSSNQPKLVAAEYEIEDD